MITFTYFYILSLSLGTFQKNIMNRIKDKFKNAEFGHKSFPQIRAPSLLIVYRCKKKSEKKVMKQHWENGVTESWIDGQRWVHKTSHPSVELRVQ